MSKAKNTEDDVAFEYRMGVLGKEVWIKLLVEQKDGNDKMQYLQGTITEMRALYPDHDITKPLEFQHYVLFGEGGDDGYYNLTEQEATGYLRWTNPYGEKKAAAVPSAIITRSASRSASKRAKITARPHSVHSNVGDPNNDEINLDELLDWLERINLESSGLSLPDAKIRSVMNRARELTTGQGVRYKYWPIGLKFYNGVRVSLKTDFDELLRAAQAFEDDPNV